MSNFNKTLGVEKYDPKEFTELKGFDPNLYKQKNPQQMPDTNKVLQEGKQNIKDSTQDLSAYEDKLSAKQPDWNALLGDMGQSQNDGIYNMDRERNVLSNIQQQKYEQPEFEGALPQSKDLENLLSREGRQQAFKEQVQQQGQNYSQGMAILDELLMGRPKNLSQVAETARDINQLQGNLQQAQGFSKDLFQNQKEQALNQADLQMQRMKASNQYNQEQQELARQKAEQQVLQELINQQNAAEAQFQEEYAARQRDAEEEVKTNVEQQKLEEAKRRAQEAFQRDALNWNVQKDRSKYDWQNYYDWSV
jgi:septal ring factor EnvC (AmiA/AmiB activator)